MLLINTLYISSRSLLVLVIGFVNTVFTVSEGLKSLSVCVEVKDGTLSLPVDFSLTSQFSSTGMYTCMYTYTTCTYRVYIFFMISAYSFPHLPNTT